MPATADVVTIGAGAIGRSTAYHLTRAGITDVLVVEMDQVGSGSSGKSASMLSLQFCAEELSGEKGGLRPPRSRSGQAAV